MCSLVLIKHSYVDEDLTPHSFTCWNTLLKHSSWPPYHFSHSSFLQLYFPASFCAASHCKSHCVLPSKNRSTPHQTTLTLPNPFFFSSLAAQERSWVCIYVHPRRNRRCRGNLLRAGSGVNSFFALGVRRSETHTNSGWLYIFFSLSLQLVSNWVFLAQHRKSMFIS